MKYYGEHWDNRFDIDSFQDRRPLDLKENYKKGMAKNRGPNAECNTNVTKAKST